MAGTFPGVSGVQQIDVDGRPNIGAQLSVFIGGTNTLAATFQDIGLAIPSTNPLIADQTGRIPLFFVADGTYKVRLTDSFGDISNGGFEYPQVPSIGSSSSGGGGSAVDPTTLFQTGFPIWLPISGVMAGYTRMNGRTIGNAVSGANESASADCQAQFIFYYNNFVDAFCPVSGGRSGNALNDFNAGKQIATLDMRLRSPHGLSDMGNADNAGFSSSVFDRGNGTTPGATLGEVNHQLVAGEQATMPVSVSSTANFVNSVAADFSFNAAQGTGFIYHPATGGLTVGTNLVSSSGTAAGGGGVHNTMSKAMLGTWYMKK